MASLSGHVEGFRAFSRFLEIDKEIKTNVVKLLDDKKLVVFLHCFNKILKRSKYY